MIHLWSDSVVKQHIDIDYNKWIKNVIEYLQC